MKQQTREATSPRPCFFIGKMARLLSTKCPSGLDTVPGPGVTEMNMSVLKDHAVLHSAPQSAGLQEGKELVLERKSILITRDTV